MTLEDMIQALPRKGGRPEAGRVILIEEIGRGNMGAVYSGWHEGLDIPVAVKFLLESGAVGDDLLERFRREAQLCARLDEPSLLRVLDFDTAGEVPFFVMEWIPGKGLDAVIESAGPLAEAEATTVLRDVGQALLGLHRAGIVHRDIKPANILLRHADGRIKLADLGLARQAGPQEAKLTAPETVLGTPAYMSPEQIENPAGVGPASDLFSLGLTAFTLLTGRLPFSGGSVWEIMNKIMTHPLDDPGPVSQALKDVLDGLAEKDPAARINRAEALLERLPTVSVPFRPEVLRSALPGRTVSRPKGAEEGTAGTLPALPSDAVETIARHDGASETWGIAPDASPSLLFCQCLQNDFLAPIGRGDALPNKLHVGWVESTRVVGPDPGTGPLVKAVSAAAACENVRIVHIRDWHDRDDPLQRPELDFFGDHCLIGTPGARFLDAIEHFSRDRSRAAVLDSVTINDFEETPMADVLEALAGEAERETMPVGVIGVWTDVKVRYLLYDLKTRAGFHNLATCSRLVASPDRVAHRETLKHLEQVLEVKVFHEVEAFLAFLGVSAGPPDGGQAPAS